MRNAWLLGSLFFRRGNFFIRATAISISLVVTICLAALLGLTHFLGSVNERGEGRDLGVESATGCLQGSYRYDPLGLEQYPRILLASTCKNAPEIPAGLNHFPQPGETFLSPQLLTIRSHDTGLLKRFPTVTGEISKAGLTSSNELYAVVGVEPWTGELPAGVATFDSFGSDLDYLSNYLRFGRSTLLIFGIFFCGLPAVYLMQACTRLNSRTRSKQVQILTIMGVPQSTTIGALVLESTLCTILGATAGGLLAVPLLARWTPTFAAWTAFPGDMLPNGGALTIAAFLTTLFGVTGAYLALLTRPRGKKASFAQTKSSAWRWSLWITGMICAIVTFWWNDDTAWPVVVAGRVLTFIGILVLVPVVIALTGRRLVRSDSPVLGIVGARLRTPSGSLTRALAALAAGLFILSVGSSTVSVAGKDPASLQAVYAADGQEVVEIRGAAESSELLNGHDYLSGALSPSADGSEILYGSCDTLRKVIGNSRQPCQPGTFFGVTFSGQESPNGVNYPQLTLTGPRAETASGQILILDSGTVPESASTLQLIPLPSRTADDFINTAIGRNPEVNVRITGAAYVSGASELLYILDVFRWGGAFAVIFAAVSVVTSLMVLFLDRYPANSYLQVLGTSRTWAGTASVLEVLAATATVLIVSLLSGYFWASMLFESSGVMPPLGELLSPTLGAFLFVVAAAVVMVRPLALQPRVSIVPDRDGLASGHDVFELRS